MFIWTYTLIIFLKIFNHIHLFGHHVYLERENSSTGNGPSPYVDAIDEEAFEEILAVNRIGLNPKYWNHLANLPEGEDHTNDSIFSSRSRLDEENMMKLGEIADRLDSFFC